MKVEEQLGKQLSGDTEVSLCNKIDKFQQYLEYITSLDLFEIESETVLFTRLKHISTRELMGRLRHSYGENPENNALSPIDVLFIDNITEEYVVIHKLPSEFFDLPQYGCTMTRLKQKGVHFLRNGKTCKEAKVMNIENIPFHIWERPYALRAQTISDMNFGDYWEGRQLVTEGNKYGDTSCFYIVGYLDTEKLRLG